MIRQLLVYLYRYFLNFVSSKIRKIRGWFFSGYRNVKIGKGVLIGGTIDIKNGVTINDSCRLFGQPKISIGQNVYINCFTMMLGDIYIEDDVLISQFVNIWGRSHNFSDRNKPIWVQHGKGGQGYKIGKIIIKKGAWIGPHVTILREITIGKGAVIGAGAVVTKNIPDYAVAFGVPAEVKYYRHDNIERINDNKNTTLLRKQIINYWNEAGIRSFDSSTSTGDSYLASCNNFVESKLLEELINKNSGCGIDIGAGLGRFTQIMARQLDCVHSLEPAKNLYEKLSSNCSTFDNVITFHSDFESFQTEYKYDFAVISGVLYLCKDDMVNEFFEKLVKYLKPKGTIIIRDFIVKNGKKYVPSFYIKGSNCFYRDQKYWENLASNFDLQLTETFQSQPVYPFKKYLGLFGKLGLTRLFNLNISKNYFCRNVKSRKINNEIDFTREPQTVFIVMQK